MFSCWGQPINLIMCPSNSTLGVYPQEMKTHPHKHMDMTVQSSVLHHSPQMEITETSIRRLMDKQEEVFSYHGILLGNKKGRTIGSCYQKNVLVLSEGSQMQETTFACFCLQEMSRKSTFEETKSRSVITLGWGRSRDSLQIDTRNIWGWWKCSKTGFVGMVL